MRSIHQGQPILGNELLDAFRRSLGERGLSPVTARGYTEHLFALCHLLGIEFMPRIKDLADQQLYKLHRDRHYGALDELFRGAVDWDLINEQWDQMVRVAAALKNRNTPPEVVVQRLASAGSADRLAKALTAFGRIIKTIYILRYIQEEELRRAVQFESRRASAHSGQVALFCQPGRVS